MFKDINSTIEYIYSLTNLENNINVNFSKDTYNLKNINYFIKKMDIELDKMKFIHIAGTKGKGSVSLLTSYLLTKETKRKVLTFTSPHLLKINERIKINLIDIKDSDIISITNKIIEKLELNITNNKPTTFEFLFLIALLYGIDNNVDYYVIEVGLGGRLDTTNVIDPIVSVINTIDYDHTNILGKKIEQIAKEKAGIIKKEKPVIIGKQIYRLENIFNEFSKNNKSEITYIKKAISIKKIKYKDDGLFFSFVYKNNKFYVLLKNIYGKHQIYNFLLAFIATHKVDKNLINRKRYYINYKLDGKVDIISKNPLLVLDVAHTEQSIISLLQSLEQHFKKNKYNFLISLSTDKNYKKIISIISKHAKSITITSLSSIKESTPQELYYFSKKINKNTKLIMNQIDSFDYVYENFIKNNDNLIVTGSFYLSGPFYKFYNNL